MARLRRRTAASTGIIAVVLVATAACSSGTTAEAPAASAEAAASAAAPAASAAASAVASAAAGVDTTTEGVDYAALCGTKPLKIAHVAGFGANSWRKITQGEIASELKNCPNVTLEYTQTDGDLQKYITAINSYVAQGYDAIVTYDDFGSQALGALQDATAAGVVVVPYIANPGGEVGKDYAGYTEYDFNTEGDQMAKWLADLTEKGSDLLVVGGLEGGSPSTEALWNGIQETNKELGDYFTNLQDTPMASSWDPAFEQKAMSGALTKYPEIDAYASDYGNATKGTLKAFVNAGRSIPPIATSATDNELGCMWLELKDKNPDFQLLTLDGTTTVVRTAARKALAALNGVPDTFPEAFALPVFVDTANGKLPVCREDMPPDADLSSNLTDEELKAVFAQ
jgi:ribose transport system substrate-binding protein